MELEAKKLIYDLDQATKLIATFTQDKQLPDYKADALLRSDDQIFLVQEYYLCLSFMMRNLSSPLMKKKQR